MPFVVAANCFAGARWYPSQVVQQALDLDDDVPVLLCDARERDDAKRPLIQLVQLIQRLRLRSSQPVAFHAPAHVSSSLDAVR